MENYKYYNEDLQLVNSCIKKYFKSCSLEIEDLRQVGLFACFKGRKLYQKNIAKLSSYLWSCIFLEICYYIKKNKTVQLLSDKITDNLTIEDTLGEDMHINELGLEKLFNQIKENVKRKLGDKSSSYLTFIDCKLNLMSNSEIKQQLNCSRQFVSKLNTQLKNDIIKFSRNTDLAKEIDYYANNNN